MCKNETNHLYRKVAEKVDNLMERRKLPLVLDLDDTLVKYFPDPEIIEYEKKAPHRVKTLKDGRKIVLVEKVHEFLDWAQRFFEISICTIGDQNYMEMILQILDPNHTRILGQKYSARYEYENILRSANRQRPAKDLGSLFSFCLTRNENRNQPGTGNALPLILDDNITAWPIEQHDNIIVVRETRNSPLWNVSLFPVVQNTLQNVYNSFFKQLDNYSSGQTKVFPSCVRCYKEFLRWELSQKISEPYGLYPIKSNLPPSTSAPASAVQPPPSYFAPPGQPLITPTQPPNTIPPNQPPPAQSIFPQQLPKNIQGPINNKKAPFNQPIAQSTTQPISRIG
ncbi:hypothetical protein BCR36DRAFT_398778 [Piromyces finnis]|uniref:protein-serine/threonine phosphatase n=1 Tax=Piromyces finnis TaxID=1754191 RepID=A0A1Y1V470_9FUNG|nr:hypothetical protein BCR36DRAFT_398778 [Piromyces finnis]|eukprot:ORX46685.1 hypothetical protein BCR36DRAFT_398778 [Piromyces finnis]